MPFVGLDPERARDLSTTMRAGAAEADGLSSEITATLTLAELESDTPGRLLVSADELDQVGIIITTRADLVDGFIIDPAVLAAELNVTLEQAEAALTALDEVERGRTATITPFLDALAENRLAADLLRDTFVNLPDVGVDAQLDQILLRLAAFLSGALTTGDLPTLTKEQVADLQYLASLVDPDNSEGFAGAFGLGTTVAAVGLSLDEMAADTLRAFSLSVFDAVSTAFELDGRLSKAAGLPSIDDLLYQFRLVTKSNPPVPPEWSVLDSWLPAFLAGEGPVSDDPADLALVALVADYVGWDGGDTQSALDYLKNGRFLQKALIPGEFEGIESPLIAITESGLEAAILAGERNGILTEEGRLQLEAFADQVLTNPDGTDGAIELSEEQQQALIGAVISQNGEAFVLDDPNIQRQLLAAVNLIGRQPSLESQRKAFADAIQAFQSLAVVGAPAMTFRQLEGTLGPDVANELSRKYLFARSSKAVGKRPQLLTLLTNWGVPGADTIKTKKRKFSFEFDEQGVLVKVRNKKISKWKRFKNTLKAFGDAWVQGWKDNPWRALFDTVKIAATVVASIFPVTSAAGIAALTVLAADTALSIADGDVLGAVSSAFGAVGGAAAYFGNVAVAGSTASMVAKGANIGQNVVDGIESADNLIDAIDDGNILGAIGSGFSLLGSAANVVSTGAEFANEVGGAFAGGDVFSSETLNTIVDTADEVAQTASDLQGFTQGLDTTITAAENGDVVAAVIGGVSTLGKGVRAATNDGGILDDGLGLSEDFEGELASVGATLVDVGRGASSGLATFEAIENDDLVGALSSGFRFAGDAATIVGNSNGAVGDLVGIEGDTAKQLVEFGQTGSRQLAEAAELGGSVVEGDVLGIIENSIDLSQLSVDDKSRLESQLRAADSVLDVARVVESVYDGGDVNLERLSAEVTEALTDIGDIRPEPEPVPEPPAPPQPNQTLGGPVAGGQVAGGQVIGSDGDGTLFIDNDGDGIADVALRPAGAASPIPEAGSDRSLPGRTSSITIQSGQTLSGIAAENGTTVERLLELNPEIADRNSIRADQQLQLVEPLEAGGAFLNPSDSNVLNDGAQALSEQFAGGDFEPTPLIDLVSPPAFTPEDAGTATLETVANFANGGTALAAGAADIYQIGTLLGPDGNQLLVGLAPDLAYLNPFLGTTIEVVEVLASSVDDDGNFDATATAEQTAGLVGATVGGAFLGVPGGYFGEEIATEAAQITTYQPTIESVYYPDTETIVTESSTGGAHRYVPHGVGVSQVTVDDGNVARTRVRFDLRNENEVLLEPDQVDRLLNGQATLEDWQRELRVPRPEALRAARAAEKLFEDTNVGLDTPSTRTLNEDFGGIYNHEHPLFPIDEIFPRGEGPNVI